MNRILIIIVVILSLIVINMRSSTSTTSSFVEEQIIKVKNKNDEINDLKLEEYVVGVVAAEMPASFSIEALKAQAVASRTYALYKINQNNVDYDVVTTVSNQSYITISEMQIKWGSDFDKYYNKIMNAVETTKNLVMKYDNEVIEAYYFAMSNGYTEDVSAVFQEDRAYLKSVKSSYDNEALNNFSTTKEFSKQDFCTKLSIDCNEIDISNIKRSATNRVNEITINGKNFKGIDVRKLLGIRSTDFTINIADNVIITTKGYGHGVGMSQYGANGMAKEGYNYEEILKYYYQDIEILQI